MTTPNEVLLARAKRLRNELDDSNARLDRQCVTAMYEMEQALQSQAERIKELELDLDIQAGSIEAVQTVNTRQADRIKALEGQLDDATAVARSDQMIAETAQAAAHARLLTERDELRAELAEIENVEPVIWAISYDGVTPYTLWHEGDGALLDLEVKRQGGTTGKLALFARPMPVQPIIGLQAIHDAITVDPTLAEIEKAEPVASHYFDIEGNLYTANRARFLRPSLNGLTPLFTCPMPAQDVKELVEALEKLARLGNGDQYGNSDGNMIARDALSKYKGAK